MTDKTTAKEYLEYIQSLYIHQSGNTYIQDEKVYLENCNKRLKKNVTNDEKEKFLNEESIRYRKLLKDVPTIYECPIRYSIMKKIEINISNTIKKMYKEELSVPLYGTVKLNDPNAMIINVPSSYEKVILFNDGLFFFISRLTRIVLDFYEPNTYMKSFKLKLTKNGIYDKIFYDKNINYRFDDMFLTYFALGDPYKSEYYEIEEPKKSLDIVFFVECIETFIMAHEFGHAKLNHLNSNVTQKRMLEDNTSIDQIIINHNNELEADNLATEITIEAMNQKGVDISFIFAAITFFFNCVEMITCLFNYIETGKYEQIANVTHPTIEKRKNNLRKYWNNFLKKNKIITNSKWYDIDDSNKYILDQLILRNKKIIDFLLKLYRDRMEKDPHGIGSNYEFTRWNLQNLLKKMYDEDKKILSIFYPRDEKFIISYGDVKNMFLFLGGSCFTGFISLLGLTSSQESGFMWGIVWSFFTVIAIGGFISEIPKEFILYYEDNMLKIPSRCIKTKNFKKELVSISYEELLRKEEKILDNETKYIIFFTKKDKPNSFTLKRKWFDNNKKADSFNKIISEMLNMKKIIEKRNNKKKQLDF